MKRKLKQPNQAKEKKPVRRISDIFITTTSLLLAFVLITVMLVTVTMPARYEIRAGVVAPSTITATKDVVDTVTTEQKRDEVANAVEPSYVLDSTVASAVLTDLEDVFTEFTSLGYLEENGAPEEVTEDMITAAQAKIAPAEMSMTRLTTVMTTSQDTLSRLASKAITSVRQHYSLSISQGQENATLVDIQRELVSAGWDFSLAGPAVDMLRPYLKANMLIDEETTALNREKAREEVESIVYIKGQNIVRAGEIVTKSQIEMLNSLGLLKEQGLDTTLLVGISLIVAIMLGLLILYLDTFEPKLLRTPSQVVLLLTIIIISVLFCFAITQFSVYLMPTILGVMLVCYLMKPRLALMTCIIISVFCGLIASGTNGIFTAAVFTVLLTTIVSGPLCIAMIRRNKGRIGLLIAGLAAGAVGMVTSISIGLTNNSDLRSVLLSSLWYGGAGLLSAVLCVGLQPILESIFNLATAAKLYDLSNPSKPLLRRLMLEAPGTYHHSIMVGNLAEAACDAIGANGLLARVGSYYHDVGKLKRPLYFKENQSQDNPHDRTDPRVSAAIILTHTHDGAAMAAKDRLPYAIRNIIECHHGRTQVLYFYDKAMRENGVENVDKADFTYTGPLPRTLEEGIVMLADSAEASVRSLKSRDRASIETMLDKIINARIENGDLNECPITYAHMHRIREAFITVLTGMYHERVQYPDARSKENLASKVSRMFSRPEKSDPLVITDAPETVVEEPQVEPENNKPAPLPADPDTETEQADEAAAANGASE